MSEKSSKPLVFIGSSVEGLAYAKAIQAQLQYTAETMIWSQGIFGLSEGPLESLVKKMREFDFAILVLTPDDLTESRGDTQKSPRDNVLLELGMFIGYLGRERTYMVVDRTAKMKLPSDLVGIEPAYFDPPDRGNPQSAVGAACTQIEGKILEVGPRDHQLNISIHGEYRIEGRIASIGIGIENKGSEVIPPYNVAFHHPSEQSTWRILRDEARQLLPKQRRVTWIPLNEPNMVHVLQQFFVPNKKYHLQLILDESDHILFDSEEVGEKVAEFMIRNAGKGAEEAMLFMRHLSF